MRTACHGRARQCNDDSVVRQYGVSSLEEGRVGNTRLLAGPAQRQYNAPRARLQPIAAQGAHTPATAMQHRAGRRPRIRNRTLAVRVHPAGHRLAAPPGVAVRYANATVHARAPSAARQAATATAGNAARKVACVVDSRSTEVFYAMQVNCDSNGSFCSAVAITMCFVLPLKKTSMQ